MDTTAPLTTSEETAWRALTYVANHLVKTLSEDLADHAPVSLSEYVVLVHLSEVDQQQMRIGALAATCGLSPSRMSRLVDTMEHTGLLTKTRTSDDARCAFATLTPSGLAALEASYPTQLRNIRRRVFDGLSADEVRVLGVGLGKIRDRLDAPIRSITP
jgi:DNA-binding MarR family transcriptional regulator